MADALPEELMVMIAQAVDSISDLVSFSMVSRHLYHCICSESFWQIPPASFSHILCYLDKFSVLHWINLPHDLPASSSSPVSIPLSSWKHGLANPKVIHLPVVKRERLHEFSHGFICTYTRSEKEKGCFEHEVSVFNPFKLSAPKDILDLPVELLGPYERVCHLYFNMDLSNGTYLVILKVVNVGFAIYQSSISKWRRGGFSRVPCYPAISIGDSVYFLDTLGRFICKLDIGSGSCSTKSFSSEGSDEFIINILFQSNGKLMAAGKLVMEIGSNWQVFCVWLLHEEKEKYVLTLVSSFEASTFYGHVGSCEFKHGHDALCIRLFELCGNVLREGRPMHGKKDRKELLVYRPSTNMWHYLDCPENLKLHFFVSTTKRIFVLPRKDICFGMDKQMN